MQQQQHPLASRIKQDATATDLASFGRDAWEHGADRAELEARLFRLWYDYEHLFSFVSLVLAAYDFQKDTQTRR